MTTNPKRTLSAVWQCFLISMVNWLSHSPGQLQYFILSPHIPYCQLMASLLISLKLKKKKKAIEENFLILPPPLFTSLLLHGKGTHCRCPCLRSNLPLCAEAHALLCKDFAFLLFSLSFSPSTVIAVSIWICCNIFQSLLSLFINSSLYSELEGRESVLLFFLFPELGT